MSRITTGRIHIKQERVALNGVVERAIEKTRPLTDQCRHTFTVSMSPQPIWIFADAAHVEQVIINLLTNAAKYTPDRGQVSIAFEQMTGYGQEEDERAFD